MDSRVEDRSMLRAGWRAWQKDETERKARARAWNDRSRQDRAGLDSAQGRTGAGAVAKQ